MEDLTILYITANLLPQKFVDFQRGVLREAIGNAPVISLTRKPINFGTYLIDDGKKCTDNIYRQMLRGARISTTPYIAIAEDDTLYHNYHFVVDRPRDDEFIYNKNRFSLFTWGTPMYHWRNRLSNCTLIAPRKLLIEALEERFAKYPDGIPENIVGELGRPMVEKNLGVTRRKVREVYSKISVIQINHDFASEERQRNHKKSYGPIRAYDIPHWGNARDLLRNIQ